MAARPGISCFGAVVGVVVRDHVFQGADTGVLEARQVRLDVVVEVCFDDCVFGFVGVAAGGAVVPVPARGRDNGFVVGQFGVVEDGGAGGFQKGDEREQVGLLGGVGVHPEAVPGEAESSVFQRGLVGEKAHVAAGGCVALLGERVVVACVDAVDGIEGVGSVADGSSKRADCVLVDALWDDACSRCEAHCGFYAYQSVAFGGIDDTAVGLGAYALLEPDT